MYGKNAINIFIIINVSRINQANYTKHANKTSVCEAELTSFCNMHVTMELIDYRSIAALDSSCGQRCTSNAIVQ